MQKIITNPHPVTVSQEEDAIFNLSINFDLLFFAGLSKIKDKKNTIAPNINTFITSIHFN